MDIVGVELFHFLLMFATEAVLVTALVLLISNYPLFGARARNDFAINEITASVALVFFLHAFHWYSELVDLNLAKNNLELVSSAAFNLGIIVVGGLAFTIIIKLKRISEKKY